MTLKDCFVICLEGRRGFVLSIKRLGMKNKTKVSEKDPSILMEILKKIYVQCMLILYPRNKQKMYKQKQETTQGNWTETMHTLIGEIRGSSEVKSTLLNKVSIRSYLTPSTPHLCTTINRSLCSTRSNQMCWLAFVKITCMKPMKPPCLWPIWTRG